MTRKQTKPRETVVFNGVPFHRYPESPSRSQARYFHAPKSVYQETGATTLHREIWKHHNGDIPKGIQIHHKDGNHLNNDIGNLEAVTAKEHRRLHATKCTDENRAHLAKIRPLALAHFKTPEGKKHCSKAGKANWVKVEEKTSVCEGCGVEFKHRNFRGKARFCSNLCRGRSYGPRKRKPNADIQNQRRLQD